jgi:hypothetical protein
MLPEGPRRASKVLRVGSKSLNGPQLLPCLVIGPVELFLLDEDDDIIPKRKVKNYLKLKYNKCPNTGWTLCDHSSDVYHTLTISLDKNS